MAVHFNRRNFSNLSKKEAILSLHLQTNSLRTGKYRKNAVLFLNCTQVSTEANRAHSSYIRLVNAVKSYSN